jgi:hypothetical protein
MRRLTGDKQGDRQGDKQGREQGDKKGQLTLPLFAASLPDKAGDVAGITSLLPCR